jgi:hypothetical protein
VRPWRRGETPPTPTPAAHALAAILDRMLPALTNISSVKRSWSFPHREVRHRDRPTLTIHAGQPFLIPPGVIRNARNITDDVTTMMLSTYFVDEKQPLVTQCH